MSKDTVILSPEYNNTGRIEALADEAIKTGVFVAISATGIEIATAALAASILSVENVSTAEDAEYVYSIGETIFCQAVPQGCLVNVKAAAAAYTQGQAVEIAADGGVVDQTAGITVGVVAIGAGKTVGAGESLTIQLV